MKSCPINLFHEKKLSFPEGLRAVLARRSFLGIVVAVISGTGAQQVPAQSVVLVRPQAVLVQEAAVSLPAPPVISAIALEATGRRLVTVGDDHLVRMWKVDGGLQIGVWAGHTDWVRTAAFSPSGKWLGTAGQDGQILLWELGLLNQVSSVSNQPVVLDHRTSAIQSLCFSRTEDLLAAAGFDGKILIYDVRSRARVAEIAGPGADIRALAFSEDGGLLAAGARNGRIRLWCREDFSPVGELSGHRARVRGLSFSPDGSRLVSGGEDRRIMVWRLPEGIQEVELADQPALVTALTWCGNRRFASGGTDNVIRVFQLPEGQEIAKLVGHSGTITSLIWDATQERLISSSFDTTVCKWPLSIEPELALQPR